MNDRISSAVENGATVVTATSRLARSLQHEYNTIQQVRGARAWQAPRILPWAGWMAELWEEFLYATEKPPVRLGAWQESVLWERVIGESPGSGELLQVNATAAVVREAWALAAEWRLDLRQAESLGNEDARAFVAWARRFREICDRERWLEQARVADCLRGTIAGFRLPFSVLLAGFDEFTPQQREFLSACSDAGCRVNILEPVGPHAGARAIRVSFADPEQEIAAAARWARNLLERGVSRAIGVVVTDLTSRRNLTERTFRGILEPAELLPGGQDSSRLINLSAGNALSTYPMIRSALAILRLSPHSNEWTRLSTFILAPFLAGVDTERSGRALLDARMRQNAGVQVSISRLRHMCLEVAPPCPLLDRALGAWLQVHNQTPERQTSGQWGNTFSAMLEAMGWPGERPLNSAEFQTMQAWAELLSQFAGTDGMGTAITIGEAVSLAERITEATMFQPETEQAPVQILGALEASGLSFDHLWIAGLDDEAWPRPPRPNPFLPIGLQRQIGLPRCSPERELEFASLVTSRLLASSPDVIVSHATQAEDRELGPSPLILSVPESAPDDLDLWNGPTMAQTIQRSRAVEDLTDEQGPPLGEAAWQRGGTRVFQYQSGCPFRAFAQLRLGAEELESPAPGLDARQRGILVHAVLEGIWKQLQTYAALCSGTDIPQAIRQAVQMAIARLEQERGVSLPERFAELERKRLEHLVIEWLELEKTREPFEVVQPEGERYAEVSGIRCKVKIDRIDRLSDGREVIIDYKTGPPRLRDWDTDRPDQPQLPLYSTIHETPLAGVLFGQVKAGSMRFIGLADQGVNIPGVGQVDLTARITEWRAVLERLGSDFRAGRAEVDPNDVARQCRFCPLGCLCRVAEAGAERDDEEADS
ncbi:MAG: PD-(D/E)XK nuclease family protein [Acidobacteriota bacterium]